MYGRIETLASSVGVKHQTIWGNKFLFIHLEIDLHELYEKLTINILQPTGKVLLYMNYMTVSVNYSSDPSHDVSTLPNQLQQKQTNWPISVCKKKIKGAHIKRGKVTFVIDGEGVIIGSFRNDDADGNDDATK